MLSWTCDNSGFFTVKSAYYCDQDSSFQPPDGPLAFDWQRIWKAKLQGRLKLLLWKFVSRAFPVKTKFFFMPDHTDVEFFLFPLCKSKIETVEHLAFQCLFVKILWAEAFWPLRVEGMQNLDIRAWMVLILNASSALSLPLVKDDDFTLQAAIILHVIWHARNLVVHEDLQPTPFSLVTSLKRRFIEHRAAWQAHNQLPHLSWCPPLEGCLKFNCDAAARLNSSFFPFAARDHRSIILLARSDFVHSSNPLLAELKAILLSVQTADDINTPLAFFESDSLCSCKFINDPNSLGPLFFLVSMIRSLLAKHCSRKLKWVPRRQNQMAHQLAAWVASSLYPPVMLTSNGRFY